ncbi:MAG TPA: D-alanyl-D-alanine carboxypeptidase family protein [Propylenella sp.]|nr:D-alanyl-D-alanine carboxypeptidase family protein [Propylenella sp.]
MLARYVLLGAVVLVAGCQSAPDRPSGAQAGQSYASTATTEDPRYAAIVVEAESGKVLHAVNADQLRYPASLSKMMTLYVLFEEMESGRLGPNSPLHVSARAAGQPPSKLGLKAGSIISVADAIPGIAVKSGNDVAAVVAENISGSEAAFAERMTRTAHRIGMQNTIFRNASGLPDPAQMTTARDMAILVRALQQRFPRFYPVFSQRTFAYQGRTYPSTNKLLGKVSGLDGVKTGYIRASGYNLATSVRRSGERLVLVVFGGPTGAARDAHVTALVDEYLPERRSWLAFR